ncbi:type VII toxin-antitoxin system MntA family adenylyltransferase antitoxin [Paenibacillus jiagnxiensis]|uniref:type VII toxin-antitoxin system MntA family adenylyltransferase antitoxin n=1 Tax=Paenibacillus jiagnxiensis TaxID=3228926 RepID=UPI0033A7FEBC
MPYPGLEPRQKSAITDYLSERFNAYTVILFGSAARGEMRQDSDVDIAFISDIPAPSPYELFMASSELADLVKREVDLIYFPQASSVFKAQIIGTGEVLHDSKPYVRQTAFMRALKEYVLLNDERKEIMESYRRG